MGDLGLSQSPRSVFPLAARNVLSKRSWNASRLHKLGKPRKVPAWNGGGGNRTPVRRCIRERIYVRSLRIALAALAPAGGISRGQPAFSLGPRAAGARGGPARSMTLEPALRAQAGRAWRPN